MCFISMYSVLITLSEYTYFHISKNITLYTIYLFWKYSVESLDASIQCILKPPKSAKRDKFFLSMFPWSKIVFVTKEIYNALTFSRFWIRIIRKRPEIVITAVQACGPSCNHHYSKFKTRNVRRTNGRSSLWIPFESRHTIPLS